MKPTIKKCAIKFCRRGVRPSEHSDKCHYHRRMAFKEKFPLKYSFGYLRRRAKERGIEFHLTYDQYEAFAIKTDYARMKGKTSLSLSVDRVEASLGYWPWNIQAITLKENSRKSYVPYFNGGKMPEAMAEEQRYFDKQYHDQCEDIALEVSKLHVIGSQNFWKEFYRRKIKLFESETA